MDRESSVWVKFSNVWTFDLTHFDKPAMNNDEFRLFLLKMIYVF